MYKIFVLLFLCAGLALAAPVAPITATEGSSFAVDFDGFTGADHSVVEGLTSSLVFSGFNFSNYSNVATRVNFQIEVLNTSTSPITASRVSGLGFFTTPDIVRSAPNSVTGVFDQVTITGNMPNGIGQVEFCFSDVNCSGGGRSGVRMGQSGMVYAEIYLRGLGHTSFSFDDMYVRYQSISGRGAPSSASGSPVPEPGAYALLLVGLVTVAFRIRAIRRMKILSTGAGLTC